MTRSRSRILFGAVAAAAVVGAGAVAVVAFTGNDSNGPDPAISLHVADPLIYDHTTLDRVACPDGRGTSPVADADHDRGDITAPTGFAEGQLVVLTMALTGPDTAAGEPVGWDVVASDALGGGIVCAFVDDSDPSSLESPEGTDATAVSTDGRLEVGGLDAAETIVVELWSTLQADVDGDAVVSLTLTPIAPADGTDPEFGASTLNFTTDIARSNRSTDDPTIDVAVDSPTVERLGQVSSTVTIDNPSDVESLSRVSVEGTVGTNATVVDIAVTDDIGALTTCTVDGSSYACDLGFMAPNEQTVLTVTATADSEEIPDGIVTPGSECSNRAPRVCHEATLTYLDSLDTTSTDDEAQTRITSGGTFTVLIEADEEGRNTGDAVDFEITVILNDPSATADTLNVASDVCDPAPEGQAQLGRGDANDDRTLQGDEVWVFVCSTESLRTATALISIIAEINDLDPVNEQYVLEFGAFDSRMELTEVPVVVGTSWNLTNVGSAPLTQVQLLPVGENCEAPRLGRNGNGDDVLDPDEVWEWACDGVDATATATAIDPVGNVISDRVEQVNTPGG